MYSFRNRLLLSAEVASPYDINRFVLTDDDADEVVEILGPQDDGNMWLAMELRIRGSGYPTPTDAIQAGKHWRDTMMIAFSHYDRGIDLGTDESPEIPHYSHGRYRFPTHKGKEMRDTPKLVAFRSDDEPNYGNWELSISQSPLAIEYLIDEPIAWLKQRGKWELTDKQRLAYRFVHASFFESNPETAYILLFTAVESIIPERFRKAEIVEVLQQLNVNLQNMTELDESAKKSVSSLIQYRENESIRYRGRNYVQLLGDEFYANKTPERFFLDAYDTRNKLAHGNVERPSSESLKDEIPELRRYLLALLDIAVFDDRVPDLRIGWLNKPE